jgi:hypothetical protein
MRPTASRLYHAMTLFLLLLGMTLPPPVLLLDRDLNAAACLCPGCPSDDKALVLMVYV